VVVSKPDPDQVPQTELPSVDKLAHEFGELTKCSQGSRREIVKDLAKKYGLSAREMYRLLETRKQN
jgi:Mor family transcriptional regulator